jgi:hypothetical protein
VLGIAAARSAALFNGHKVKTLSRAVRCYLASHKSRLVGNGLVNIRFAVIAGPNSMKRREMLKAEGRAGRPVDQSR